jgi:methyl-accepting chemotaxis protein
MKFLNFKKMSVGFRLSFLISLLAFVGISSVMVIISLVMNGFAKDDATLIALETAKGSGLHAQVYLQKALDEARSLGELFTAATNVEDARMSRRQVNAIFRNFIERRTEFFGVYVAFEPNAFDGRDREYAGSTGHDASGRFVPYWTRNNSGKGVVEALVDYETVGVGDYYQQPKLLGHEALIDPYLYNVQGRDVLMVSLVVPVKDAAGKFTGIAGIDLTLDAIQQFVAGTTLYRTGRITMLSANGTIVGAKDISFVNRKVTDLDGGAELAPMVATGKEFSLERKLSSGVSVLTVGAPFSVGATASTWMIVADVPLAEVLASVRQIELLIILFGAVAVIGVITLTLLLARSVSVPLGRAVAFAQRVADGYVNAKLDAKGREDEIGRLAVALNGMTDGLRTLAVQIQDGAGQVAASSEELSATAQQVSRGAQEQASTLEETAASMEELTASVEQVATHAGGQGATVETTSRRMEEMQSSVTVVSETLAKVAVSSGESVQRARQGAENVQKAVTAIKDISSSSEQIAGIVDVISEIASQINLLALNAAIEAARAGEHGRGFAVVADEVGKLAERSAQASKEIEALIKATLKQVGSGVGLAEESGRSMEQIIGGAQRSTGMVDELQKSIGQQIGAIQEMAKAIEELRAMSQSIGAATGEQTTNAKQVAKAVESVNEITQQAASASEEMASSTEELASMAAQLQSVVARFKIDDAGAQTSAAPSTSPGAKKPA